jgi:hypothetical protein
MNPPKTPGRALWWLGLFLFGAMAGVANASSVYTVTFTGLIGGPLQGGTVIITTGIEDGSLWNTNILQNEAVADHAGVVTAIVTGSVGADGTYTYTGSGLVGFNVNTVGSGRLFSIEEDSLSNIVTLTRGIDQLAYYFSFDLPNDNGITTGLPVLDTQLPAISSGTGSLSYNDETALVGNVAAQGVTAVPEPAGALLLGLGALILAGRRRRT